MASGKKTGSLILSLTVLKYFFITGSISVGQMLHYNHMDNQKNVYLVKNILAIDALNHLRDQTTNTVQFRHYSDTVCRFVFSEAVQTVKTKQSEISTPLEKISVDQIEDEIIVISILRAGMAMLYGAMQLLPKIKIGFVGLERDESTAIAKEYYWKLPVINKGALILIIDPMLATGGSMLHVIKKLQEQKAREIRIVSVIASPEGIATIHHTFPQVAIYTAVIDRELNNRKYILPGLGDYGDRYFGTV